MVYGAGDYATYGEGRFFVGHPQHPLPTTRRICRLAQREMHFSCSHQTSRRKSGVLFSTRPLGSEWSLTGHRHGAKVGAVDVGSRSHSTTTLSHCYSGTPAGDLEQVRPKGSLSWQQGRC